MSIQPIRENCDFEQTIRAKPVQTAVEAEALLPGGLREEARIFSADAMAVVRDGDISAGRLNAEGKVVFRILYAQGDMKNVRSIEVSADFSQPMPLDIEKEAGITYQVKTGATVQYVTAKASNGRLIMRAILLLHATASTHKSLSVVSGFDKESVQTRYTSQTLQRCVGEGQVQSCLKEEFDLPQVLEIKNTLYATANARVEDIISLDGGKIRVIGTINLEAYHTSSSKRSLVYTRHSMPYEQEIALSAGGNAIAAQTNVLDVAAISQDNGDKNLLRTEIVLQSDVWSTEDTEVNLLEDAYALEGEEDVHLQTQKTYFRTGSINEQTAESGKSTFILPEGAPRIQQVLLSFARPVLIKAERKMGKLQTDGVVVATIIYCTEDSDIPVSAVQELPFQALFTTQGTPDDVLDISFAEVEGTAVTGDRIELKYIMRLNVSGSRVKETHAVTDVELSAISPRPVGLSIVYLQADENLWDIAKKYRVPLSSINRLNPEAEEPSGNKKVLLVYKKP